MIRNNKGFESLTTHSQHPNGGYEKMISFQDKFPGLEGKSYGQITIGMKGINQRCVNQYNEEDIEKYCVDKQRTSTAIRRFFVSLPEYENHEYEKRANEDFEKLLKDLGL